MDDGTYNLKMSLPVVDGIDLSKKLTLANAPGNFTKMKKRIEQLEKFKKLSVTELSDPKIGEGVDGREIYTANWSWAAIPSAYVLAMTTADAIRAVCAGLLN